MMSKRDLSQANPYGEEKEKETIHNSPKRVVILGSGFAGVEVLKRLQNK